MLRDHPQISLLMLLTPTHLEINRKEFAYIPSMSRAELSDDSQIFRRRAANVNKYHEETQIREIDSCMAYYTP